MFLENRVIIVLRVYERPLNDKSHEIERCEVDACVWLLPLVMPVLEQYTESYLTRFPNRWVSIQIGDEFETLVYPN